LARTFQDRRVHLRPDSKADAEPLPEFAVTGDHEQLVLFGMRRDLAAHGALDCTCAPTRPAPPPWTDSPTTWLPNSGGPPACWRAPATALRIVLGIQDRPNAPINASDVTLLRDVDLPIWPVMKVLAAAGDLVEDRTPALDRWFTQQIDGLPEAMVTEPTAWYEVMKHGSPTSPRRPRPVDRRHPRRPHPRRGPRHRRRRPPLGRPVRPQHPSRHPLHQRHQPPRPR
jgi:hypothetical protein